MEERRPAVLQKLTDKYSKAEFLTLMYPDKEAVKGIQIIDDLLTMIISDEVEFSQIDREALLYFGGLDSPEHEQMLAKAEVEYGKIQEYASQISGVSLERIRAADEFWFTQLTE